MKIFFSIFLLTFSQFLGAQNGSPKVEIKNIGSLVNSSFSDFAPLISADGSTMVFTSLRPADKTRSTPNAAVKKDVQKIKDANSAIFITYYDEKSKTWIEPIMLESVVNLAGVDNSAIALSNDGERMLLYRSGNNKNINKGVFETTLKGNEWSVPKRLPAPINSDGNETSASFSPDGKTIYFVSSRPEGLGGRDIWYCIQNEAGDWGEAVNIGNLINTKEDEESVFLHPNGSSLFFSSKGHNSTGGYDIFVSHLDTVTNIWAKAINLGSPINTPGDDLYFVMAANEKTAYYASSKPKVVGDKDIYSITLGESILTKHITLVKGFVIGENGLGIESKIVVKEKLTGDIINTLKSNKATGKFLVSLPAIGEYQINFTDDNNGTYTEFIEASEKNSYNEVVLNIVLEPKYANIFSRVLDEEGNPIPKVQIELIDIITKQLIGKFETNSAGASRFSLPFETKFNIVFIKHGYLFQSVNVSIPKSSGSESKDIKDITLQKVEVGKKITINNVFFDYNQEIPQQQSFADLDRIIKLMNDMNSLHVEISGHTDNVGFQDNKKLSEQKAKAVMNYLVGKGCEKSRLKYKGYGSTDPITTNETEEGRQLNSRIELKVLKVDPMAEQIAEEKRIQSGSDNVKVNDVISPYPIINEEEQVPENKDSILAANKKDENFDAIKEAFGEDQSLENKDSTLTTLKKDEITTDTPIIVEEEKIQENNSTIIAEVKKEETTADTPIVIEEEKIQEDKETVVAEVKKEETTTDTPVVVEEENGQENEETIIAEVKKEEIATDTPVVVEEEKIQESKETVVAEVKKEETTADTPIVVEEEKIQESKETVVAEVKTEDTTADTPIVVEKEKILENKETVVAEVKTEETTADTPIVVEEEKISENKETVVAEVKTEEITSDDPIVVEEGNGQENKETIIAEVKKEETTTDTPVVVEEEKIQENKETIIAEVKKEETTVVTPIVVEEEKNQENKETVVAEVKTDDVEEQKYKERLDSVVNSSWGTDPNKQVEENQETVIAEIKKDEKTEDISLVVEEEKNQENKETVVADVKKDETTEDPSKELLLKENQELAKKIDAMEQKYKASLDSIVNASWGAEGTPVVEEQDINADSANLEYVDEQTDTTVVAEYADEEYTSASEENGELSEIIADENADSAEDSLSMEIKNIGSLVNSRFPDYAPLIHADGNVMIFSTNRPLTETAVPVTPPAKKGKPQKLENKGGKTNIYTSYYDLKDKKWLAPRKLGPTINLTDVNNSAIALSNDGQKMILYRYDGNQTENGDLFESSLNGEEWSIPLRLPASINSNDNETSASISPDGKTIYFVSNRKLGVGEKDIWYSTRENTGIWGNAVNIGESINTDKDEESVFIHPNGNTLFFSSKGHNSIGGYDIFMSDLDSATGEWGTPKNLGRSINTTEDDMYFTLAANGKKGYYSSSKPNGIGETDIYSVVLGSDIIKKNTTLVKGFITDENGEGIKSKIEIIDKSTDETFGIFNSNRITGKYLVSLPTGKKYDLKITADGYTAYVVSLDISFKTGYNEIVKNIVLETKNVFITSRMFNETGKPISVLIEAIDNASLQLIDKSESDNEGYSKIAVPSGKELAIFFSKPGYLFQSVNLSIPKSTEFESKDLKNITMQKVEAGKKTVLKTISFDFNQTIPRQESFLDLDRIVTLMKDVASVEIEISGHTDNVGSKKDNSKLSTERAKALVDLLINKGIDKKRLKYKGYGSNEPISSNDTETGRKANNRTELKVLKVDLKAEELAEERRIKEAPIANIVSLKPDETIVSVDEKQAQENNDTVAIVDKKDGNNDAPIETGEEKTQENIEPIAADVKKDENMNDTLVVVEEEKIDENKETDVADVKKDENTNETGVVVEEEKIGENKETVVADVKKDENTNKTPIVVEEDKIEENKETVVADVKKDENTNDTPVVVEEDKIEENKETVVADVKKDDAAERRYKERLDSVVNASWGADPNEQVQENKETEIAIDKKDENIDSAIETEEEKLQENKEIIVSDKKDESSDTPVETGEEKTQENNETIVADKTDESNDTPVGTGEEKTQENNETIIADKTDESNDTPVETGEEKTQENNETIIADKKETNNSGNFSRHMLESYAADKKEGNTKSNKVEIIHEKQEPLEIVADKKEETADPEEEVQSEESKEGTLAVSEEPLEVVADKKEETADPTDIVKSEETKETTLAVNENEDVNVTTKETTEATKSNNTSTLPERYKEFDKDVNGTITYDEIIKMIDSFFDDAPNVKQEDITSIIDYFFSD